jgi:hypothetical protein
MAVFWSRAIPDALTITGSFLQEDIPATSRTDNKRKFEIKRFIMVIFR